MLTLPLLGPGGLRPSLDRQPVVAVDGSLLAELHLAPPMLIPTLVSDLRAAPIPEPEDCLAVLSRAAELFAAATIDAQSPEDYCQDQARCSGVPIAVARSCLRSLGAAMAAMPETVAAQQPPGTRRWKRPEGGAIDGAAGAVWVPKARVLGVIAPSNHPGTQVGWLEALALGYRVALRPGRRDPFTPWRLARCLIEAGLDPSSLAFVPGPHAAAHTLVEAADLALVYGNDGTVQRYRDRARVLVRGPGRSKVLVDGEVSGSTVDFLVSSISADAGVRCTNTSAILVAGDHEWLAHELAARLANFPIYPPTDAEAVLPVLPLAEARRVRAWLDDRVLGARELLSGRGLSGGGLSAGGLSGGGLSGGGLSGGGLSGGGLSGGGLSAGGGIADLGDGSAALRPAVIVCDGPDHPHFGRELPFPCVWVAPWSAEQGLGPLRGSLAVTLLTSDEALVRSALSEPTIRQVSWGPVPASRSAPGVPHDGYLGQFLMEAKAFSVCP